MKPPGFDESTIRSLAADASYYRGEEYYEAGAVGGLTLEGVEVVSLEWSDLGNNIKASCKYKGKKLF